MLLIFLFKKLRRQNSNLNKYFEYFNLNLIKLYQDNTIQKILIILMHILSYFYNSKLIV